MKEIEEIDRSIRDERGLGAGDVVASGAMVLEIARLADPWAIDGLDVVIPGTRDDLARLWIEARLDGRGGDDADRKDLAREIAPPPDEHLLPYYDQTKKRTRYRSDNKRLDAITRAATEYFKRDRDGDLS